MNQWETYEPPAVKTQAAFQANGLEERIIIPGLKAAIVGVASGLLSGLAIGALHIPVSVLYTMGIVTVASFLLVFWSASRRGQWVIERISGCDLNNDGYIGAPPAQAPMLPPETVRVELLQDNARRGDYIDLPYPEKIPQFAETVLAGRTYSQSAMVGTGKLFKRDEYDALMDALVTAGLMRWKNPEHHNIGAVPTYAGKAVLKRFLPSPTDGE